jgi:hypothetical protein
MIPLPALTAIRRHLSTQWEAQRRGDDVALRITQDMNLVDVLSGPPVRATPPPPPRVAAPALRPPQFGRTLSVLRQLQRDDPGKFGRVIAEIVDQLRADARSHVGLAADFLADLARRFEQAAASADLSLLEAPAGCPTRAECGMTWPRPTPAKRALAARAALALLCRGPLR